MDELTKETIVKRDELRRLLPDGDADQLVQAARNADSIVDARMRGILQGRPPVDRDLILELNNLIVQAVERANDLGSNEAALWLGDIRYDLRDMDGAMTLFVKRAEAGDPVGASKAAELIRRLEQSERYADALGWLKAAVPHDPDGGVHYVLGLYVFNGLGCPADQKAGFELQQQAATLGNADAMFELYAMFTHGAGCEANPERAVEWCVRAAEGGSMRAMYNMGTMYATGSGLPEDKALSVEWYARAVENGHGRAAATLGCMYAMGTEIEPDKRKARGYFARADALGYDWRPMAASGGLSVEEWEVEERTEPSPRQKAEEGVSMRDQLLALPQNEDVWIAGAQVLQLPAKGDKEEQDFWLLVVQSRTQDFVQGIHTSHEQPDAQALLSTLVEAMFEPKEGTACRPAAVEQGPNLSWAPVVPMLEQIGIEVRPAGTLYDLNTVFQHLSVEMTGKMISGLPVNPE